MHSPNATSSPNFGSALLRTKTLTEESIQEIKDRVCRAANEGLSQIAHGGLQSMHSSNLSTPQSACSSFGHPAAASSAHLPARPLKLQRSTSALPSAASATHLKRSNSSSMWNFHDRDLFPVQQLAQLPASVSLAEQERLVVDELLHCLVGVRGAFIVPLDDSRPADRTPPAEDDDDIDVDLHTVSFRISERLNASIRAQVQEILPLASDYSCLQRFALLCSGTGASGQVQQALGAAVRRLLFDYYVFLVQLETEHTQSTDALTLAKLLYFVRPTMAVFRELAQLVRPIHEQRLNGASILTHLYDSCTAQSGAKAVQAIIVQLTHAAARPYMDMLHLWIHKGIILPDAAQEFLVADNEHIRTDFIHIDHYSAEYWEKRYTVCADRVPAFMRSHADRILRAGKYLNVLRQCGGSGDATRDDSTGTSDPPPAETMNTVPFSASDSRLHGASIEAAYTHAARTLLKVLVHDADLMGHLQSVKRYLLLHQGDFINQFMDAAEKELAKNVDRVQPMRLDNLLGLTLRVASTKYDRYNDDLHCQLFPFELCTQMEKIHLAGSGTCATDEDFGWSAGRSQRDDKINLTGLECFAFRYEVSWPVSLVLNHFAILEYQMLFRQLFYCKHVERQLCKVWKENNNANKFAPAAAELYRSAFTLRQRMMSAVQNIEYYMMIEVIEPTWHEFVGKLDAVSNVDEVLQVHQDFLDDCLYNCMLKTPELLRAVTKLCNICLAFCKFIQNAQAHFEDAELTSMLRSADSSDSDSDGEQSGFRAQSESSMAPTETFAERIKRFDLEFTFVLIGLLKQINEISYEDPNSKLINLVHRINFNSYYNTHLEQMSCKNAKVNLRTKPSVH